MVEVILTESGCKFITPLSFQSVTARRHYRFDLWGRDGHVTHIGLGHAADLMVIAPASANTIAKLANGIGDNLLSVTALAATCPLIIAPAMMRVCSVTRQPGKTLKSSKNVELFLLARSRTSCIRFGWFGAFCRT